MTLDYAARNPLPLDVISIQSQVVYGTVGNNAALPTLARHGIRATAVPTVFRRAAVLRGEGEENEGWALGARMH